MGVRSGKQYLAGLREQEREVWLGGERVRDVTTHPGLKGGAQAIASLYDMQCDPKFRDQMTYVSPSSGERVGLSFIIPRTREDLERRSAMMLAWARTTCGMMGRSPDFMNVTYAAWAGASEFFAQGRPEFGENMRRYYEYIRENDLTLTHALINLQRSRTASGVFNLQEGTALEVVRETDAGIIVRGARILATLGPLADEIGVYSPRMGRHTENHSPFALSFAIPCDTPGLKFLCRDSFDQGRSHFDQPLGSRFEEMDCIVFFDDVVVPWERVFLLGDVDRLNATAHATHSSVHSAHQGAAKNLAKCEFVLGTALLMTQTLGNAHLPHVEERIGELMLMTQLTRACIRAAEADAKLDEWGVMCPDPLMAESPRNLFMNAYPRMIEILQLLGSSSFMLTPSEADFKGPLKSNIEQYLATDTTPAKERVKLFRLAWDLCGNAFGSRQVLYERFFASDPLTRARALASIYPKGETMERVLAFLGRDADAGDRVTYHRDHQPSEDTMAKRPMYLQHVNLYVRDAERSKEWYEDLLGLHTYEYRPGWAAFMSADTEQSHEVALMQLGPDAPLQQKGQVGLNHFAWRLESLDDLKEFYLRLKEKEQPIEHISDHGISLGIYLRDPDGNGVEVFYEMPRAEWPVDYHVFTREKTGRGRFPGPWDAEIRADGPPAQPQPVAAQ